MTSPEVNVSWMTLSIGNSSAMFRASLLDSAIKRPRASAFGEDASVTFEMKAAALLHSIAKNRALVEGNKRTAWLCTAGFGDLNGVELALTSDEAYDLVLEVASTQMELPEIPDRLQVRSI